MDDLWDNLAALPIEDLDGISQPLDLDFGVAPTLQVGYEASPSPENEPQPQALAYQPQQQQQEQDISGLFTPRTLDAMSSLGMGAPAPVPAAPLPAFSTGRAVRRKALNPQGESGGEDDDEGDDDDEEDEATYGGRSGGPKRSRKASGRNEERMLRKKSREKMRRRRVNELFDDMAEELSINGTSNRVQMLMRAVDRIRQLKAELAASREQASRAGFACAQAGVALPLGPQAAVPVSLEGLRLDADAAAMDWAGLASATGVSAAFPAAAAAAAAAAPAPLACSAGSCQPIMAAPAPTRRSARQRTPTAASVAAASSSSSEE